MKKIKILFLFLAILMFTALVLSNSVCIATTEKDVDTIIKKLAPDGENATLYMKEPTTMEEADFAVSGYVSNILCGADYSVYGYYDIDSSKLFVEFYSEDFAPANYIGWDSVNGQPIYSDPQGWTKQYELNATFVAPTANATVTGYINKLNNFSMMDDPDSDMYYVVEDLSLINYYLTSAKSELWNPGAPGRALKYSTLNNTTKGSNITYYLDIRAGDQDESLMYECAFGPMSVFYNGYSYGTKEEGLYLKRTIYIPEDTANTTAAFVNAAQKRINDYLGNDTSVVVSYGGTLSSLPEGTQDVFFYPITNHDGNYYNVKVGSRTYKFYIIKASAEKLVEPTYIGSDIKSKIEITSEDASIPLDTSLNVKNVTDNSIKDKIGTENYKSYDITLYSDAKGAKIEKLDNGKFEVKIPVPAELEGKDLTVYYITTAGEKEEHEVTVKDGYAVFTTDHFSIYTLAEKIADTTDATEQAEPTENTTTTTDEKGEKDETPKTGVIDIASFVALVTIIAGLGIVVLKKRI